MANYPSSAKLHQFDWATQYERNLHSLSGSSPRGKAANAAKQQAVRPLEYKSPESERLFRQRHPGRELNAAGAPPQGMATNPNEPIFPPIGQNTTKPSSGSARPGQAKVAPKAGSPAEHIYGYYGIGNHEAEHAWDQTRNDALREVGPAIGDLVFLGERFANEQGRPLQHDVQFPTGQTHDINWMREQARKHGYWDGRPMSDLLFNTPEGRQWLEQTGNTTQSSPATQATPQSTLNNDHALWGEPPPASPLAPEDTSIQRKEAQPMFGNIQSLYPQINKQKGRTNAPGVPRAQNPAYMPYPAQQAIGPSHNAPARMPGPPPSAGNAPEMPGAMPMPAQLQMTPSQIEARINGTKYLPLKNQTPQPPLVAPAHMPGPTPHYQNPASYGEREANRLAMLQAAMYGMEPSIYKHTPHPLPGRAPAPGTPPAPAPGTPPAPAPGTPPAPQPTSTYSPAMDQGTEPTISQAELNQLAGGPVPQRPTQGRGAMRGGYSDPYRNWEDELAQTQKAYDAGAGPINDLRQRIRDIPPTVNAGDPRYTPEMAEENATTIENARQKEQARREETGLGAYYRDTMKAADQAGAQADRAEKFLQDGPANPNVPYQQRYRPDVYGAQDIANWKAGTQYQPTGEGVSLSDVEAQKVQRDAAAREEKNGAFLSDLHQREKENAQFYGGIRDMEKGYREYKRGGGTGTFKQWAGAMGQGAFGTDVQEHIKKNWPGAFDNEGDGMPLSSGTGTNMSEAARKLRQNPADADLYDATMTGRGMTGSNNPLNPTVQRKEARGAALRQLAQGDRAREAYYISKGMSPQQAAMAVGMENREQNLLNRYYNNQDEQRASDERVAALKNGNGQLSLEQQMAGMQTLAQFDPLDAYTQAANGAYDKAKASGKSHDEALKAAEQAGRGAAEGVLGYYNQIAPMVPGARQYGTVDNIAGMYRQPTFEKPPLNSGEVGGITQSDIQKNKDTMNAHGIPYTPENIRSRHKNSGTSLKRPTAGGLNEFIVNNPSATLEDLDTLAAEQGMSELTPNSVLSATLDFSFSPYPALMDWLSKNANSILTKDDVLEFAKKNPDLVFYSEEKLKAFTQLASSVKDFNMEELRKLSAAYHEKIKAQRDDAARESMRGGLLRDAQGRPLAPTM